MTDMISDFFKAIAGRIICTKMREKIINLPASTSTTSQEFVGELKKIGADGRR